MKIFYDNCKSILIQLICNSHIQEFKCINVLTLILLLRRSSLLLFKDTKIGIKRMSFKESVLPVLSPLLGPLLVASQSGIQAFVFQNLMLFVHSAFSLRCSTLANSIKAVVGQKTCSVPKLCKF